MPQPVGQFEEPHPVVGGDDVAVLVEVREIRHAGAEPLGGATADMAGRLVRFELAEMAGEDELRLVGEKLIAEHQHRIPVHARFDRGDLVRAERLMAIDAGDLADEQRMQWADRHGHL